uniref:Chromosome-associated kinesin KIF4-like n=2 Tax=Hirondellea gigas TaxID=1518452 RepID=A0A6A7FV47_9CRUS
MAVDDATKKSCDGTNTGGSGSSGGSNRCIPVRVAVRVRPLVQRAAQEYFSSSLEVLPEHKQISIGSDSNRSFTYDYVFTPDCGQEEIYNAAVSKVVLQLYKGFNVTVLAYGQTGSGKTYSMGTNYVLDRDNEEEMGIIPRAINDIFKSIKDREQDYEFIVKVSFVELYADNLFDLLNVGSREECLVEIRETPTGDIIMQGVTEVPVTSLRETMRCLEQGSLNRATGATAMNAHSSRSHALFCMTIEQRRKDDSENMVCAKFTLVDLAGSERAKKTGATGMRFKEGVNINQGLLALGNVISSLAAKEKYTPYRVCKLTRLLQDSLGGNSHTLMLACVSPADDSLEETLSTLRYADRARKIKNKPIVNTDPRAAELCRLKQQVQELQVQLITARAMGGGEDGNAGPCNVQEMGSLTKENSLLKDENNNIMRALQAALEENTNMAEKALMAEMSRDRLKQRLQELRAQTGNTVENLNKTLNNTAWDPASTSLFVEQINLVKDLEKKVITLQAEQHQSEKALVAHELIRLNASTAEADDSSTGDADDDAGVDQHSGEGAFTDDSTEFAVISAADDGSVCGVGEGGADDTTEATTTDSPGRAYNVAFTLKQSKLTDELSNLNRALAQKEQLMGQMVDNDAAIKTMRCKYETAIKELETQISAISKEKEDLQGQLEKTPKNVVNKISEQRRLRLQELTAQIDELRHKVLEKNKMLKMKEATDRKVNVLSNEIMTMKQTRVRLVRQMKEDGEKFRLWKSQKNKEIAKLKQQERRKEFQMVKMERLNSKQQNVLKRKIEEAVSINKRLKDAMALQKACADKRANSRDTGSLQSRVKTWLDGELEFLTVKKQAKHSLHSLRDDRKTISDQLAKVCKDLRQEELSPAYRKELQDKKRELDNDLQLRTAQITDIQQKCLDEGDDAAARDLMNKKRFESIQSMVEAKVAMGMLFETAAQSKADIVSQKSECKDAITQYKEVVRSMEECEAQLSKLKRQHKKEVTAIERDHEDKLLYFLREMGANPPNQNNTSTPTCSTPTSSGPVSSAEHQQLKQRLSFQDAEIKRLSKLHDDLQTKILECEELQRLLDVERTNSVNRNINVPTIEVVGPVMSSKSVLPKPVLKKVRLSIREPDEAMEFISSGEEEDEEEEDDDTIDPDWKKTPLFKRIRSMKRQRGLDEFSGTNDEDKENNTMLFGDLSKFGSIAGIKRNSDGEVKCGCNGDCASRRCACRKSSSKCSISCKCNPMKCDNKETPDSSINSYPSSADNTKVTDTVLNSTFDVSNQLQAAVKKPRLSPPNGESSLSSTAAVNGSSSNNSSSSNTTMIIKKKKLNETFVKPFLPLAQSPQLF